MIKLDEVFCRKKFPAKKNLCKLDEFFVELDAMLWNLEKASYLAIEKRHVNL